MTGNWDDSQRNFGQKQNRQTGEAVSHRIVTGLLGAAAVSTVMACDGGAVTFAPRMAGPHRANQAGGSFAPRELPLGIAASAAPGDDSGVVEAAQVFAIRLVTPNLAVPSSADFPETAIHFERLNQMNQTTGNRIEHWLVDGAVDSEGRFSRKVRSHWRLLLGRDGAGFFPEMAALEGHEIYQMPDHRQLLADARQAAWDLKQSQESARKTVQLAENRAAWKAIEDARSAEEKAEAALKLAQSLLDAGRTEPARKRLQGLIEKFPGTRAAAKAEELLKE
jgi:hypothetical protein